MLGSLREPRHQGRMLSKRPDRSARIAEKRIVTPAALLSALLGALCLCVNASAEVSANGAFSRLNPPASTTPAPSPIAQRAASTVAVSAASRQAVSPSAPAAGAAVPRASRQIMQPTSGAVTGLSTPTTQAVSGAGNVAGSATVGLTHTLGSASERVAQGTAALSRATTPTVARLAQPVGAIPAGLGVKTATTGALVGAASKVAAGPTGAQLSVVASERSQTAGAIAKQRLPLSPPSASQTPSASQPALAQHVPGKGQRLLVTARDGGPRVPPGGAGVASSGAQPLLAGNGHMRAELMRSGPAAVPEEQIQSARVWRSPEDFLRGSERWILSVISAIDRAGLVSRGGGEHGGGPPPARWDRSPEQAPSGIPGTSAGAAGGVVAVALALALTLLLYNPRARRRLVLVSAPSRAAPFLLMPERPG